MGIVIASPLALTWTAKLREHRGHPQAVVLGSVAEMLVLSICLVSVTCLVFGTAFEFPYAIFPFLIWAAVKYGPSGSALAVSMVSAISIIATLRGLGPFARSLPEASLLHLQAWTATVSVTALVLAAAIAERMRAEGEIANLNRQLNLAMEETHHRVKNNLQIVAAMVDFRLLQDKAVITPEDMRSLGSHVRALAVVHDILTREARQSGEARTVSAKCVLDELIPLIQASADGKEIEFEIDDARLSTREGTSLALVANELINNAFKHGRGTVEVSFVVKNGTGLLNVRDQGDGFPKGFQVDFAETSGLSMVANLVRVDLSGSVSFNGARDSGAQVSVQLPIQSGGNGRH